MAQQGARKVTDPPVEFEMFCRVEYPRLVGAVGLFCGDANVGEDIAQEALIRALDRWEQVRELDRPGAWVQKVALNLATSHLRRQRLERAVGRLVPARQHRTFDDGVVREVVLRRALGSLPPRQRAVVVLRFYLDRSVNDTAEVLGITPGSTRVLTHRALTSLRDRFGLDVGGGQEKETSDVR